MLPIVLPPAPDRTQREGSGLPKRRALATLPLLALTTVASFPTLGCVTVTDSGGCDGMFQTASVAEVSTLFGVEGSAEDHVADLESIHHLRIRDADPSTGEEEVIAVLEVEFAREGLHNRCSDRLILPGSFTLKVDGETILSGDGEPELGGFARYTFDAEGTPRFYALVGVDGPDHPLGAPTLSITADSDDPADFEFAFERCSADGWCQVAREFSRQ